jgi:hypothetical protein
MRLAVGSDVLGTEIETTKALDEEAGGGKPKH